MYTRLAEGERSGRPGADNEPHNSEFGDSIEAPGTFSCNGIHNNHENVRDSDGLLTKRKESGIRTPLSRKTGRWGYGSPRTSTRFPMNTGMSTRSRLLSYPMSAGDITLSTTVEYVPAPSRR